MAHLSRTKQAEQALLVRVSVCTAHYWPPGGTDDHRLCRLLHLHLLPRHHSGHLRCFVVSIFTSSYFITHLMVSKTFPPLFSSVSTIRNQRYHIHANLSFAILVAEILLLISARFDPGTVGTFDPRKIWLTLLLLFNCCCSNVCYECCPISFPVRSWPSCFISSS